MAGRVTSLFVCLLTMSINLFSAADCDRACLKTTLDQYLNAVVKHDRRRRGYDRFRKRKTPRSSSSEPGSGNPSRVLKSATAIL